MKHVRNLLFIVVLCSIVLAACAPNPPTPALPQVDVRGWLDKGSKYYNDGVKQETDGTVAYRDWELWRSNFQLGTRDLIANKKSCFMDAAATESVIGQAVVGNLDGEAIFSALVTQSVSGEAATVECVQLNRQLADYVIANRAAGQDKYMKAFKILTGYMQYLSGWPEVDIMNDLLQTYGDTAKVYEVLADNGIGVSDWSWLPTANLWVSHSDENLCRYYTSGEFMANVSYSTKLKFTGHEDALARLYESAWNPVANGGRGECRMTRMAALEYMTRSILSSDTRQVIETGEDTGVFPTETP